MARKRLSPKNREPYRVPRGEMTLDDITFKLDNISSSEWLKIGRRMGRLRKERRFDEMFTLVATLLVPRCIVSWPYDQPITAEGFENLGIIDSKTVLDAIVTAGNLYADQIIMGSTAN